MYLMRNGRRADTLFVCLQLGPRYNGIIDMTWHYYGETPADGLAGDVSDFDLPETVEIVVQRSVIGQLQMTRGSRLIL